MRLWRVVLEGQDEPWRPPRYAHRWNTGRVAVTYAATTAALAVSEVLVYVRHVDELEGRLLMEAEYGGTTERLNPLPKGWNQWPHDRSVQQAGDAWVERASAGALEVPTVLLPEGSNVMLNQDHTDFRDLKGIAEHPLSRFQR